MNTAADQHRFAGAMGTGPRVAPVATPEEAAPAAKPRKVRGPSKKLILAMATAREEGYTMGINAPRDKWPGAFAAVLLAAAAFGLGVWLF